MLRRLDQELVRRKLARSREHAQQLIADGFVVVGGSVSDKAARQVDENISITVKESVDSKWVSRGAHKLIGALNHFPNFKIKGMNILDAGASTGGFTQVCLEKEAAQVVALDVGYGQLAWQLRTDPRVKVIERFNVRNLKKSDLPCEIDVVVADLSFISLRTVLPALVSSTSDNCNFLLMVKPQFEVGKDQVGNGVVLDPLLRASAVKGVVEKAIELGLELVGVGASPLPGPNGNVEYFVWFKHAESGLNVAELADQINLQISDAIAKGPQ